MTRFEKWAVLSTSAATAVTGAAYLGVKYLMEPTDPWAVINHPIQPWLLKAHILVAPLMVFAIGMIAMHHIWQHFRRGLRLGRKTGLVGMGLLAPMIVSGYLIQSVTAEGWLLGIAWSHIITSSMFTAALTGHAWVVLRRPRGATGRIDEPPQAASKIPVPPGRVRQSRALSEEQPTPR